MQISHNKNSDNKRQSTNHALRKHNNKPETRNAPNANATQVVTRVTRCNKYELNRTHAPLRSKTRLTKFFSKAEKQNNNQPRFRPLLCFRERSFGYTTFSSNSPQRNLRERSFGQLPFQFQLTERNNQPVAYRSNRISHTVVEERPMDV